MSDFMQEFNKKELDLRKSEGSFRIAQLACQIYCAIPMNHSTYESRRAMALEAALDILGDAQRTVDKAFEEKTDE